MTQAECLTAIFDDPQVEELSDPIAFATSADPYTMYHHQEMKESDAEEFVTAMNQELSAHEQNNHWEIVDKDIIPTNMKILPTVWSMNRKRRIATGQVYKYKACLNLHGGKQEYGIN